MNDLIEAVYLESYRILLKFANGKSGIVDFSKYLNKGGIFDKFKDLEYFKKFEINKDFNVLGWFNEIDIAPETLYADATGESLPDWMLEDKYKKAS